MNECNICLQPIGAVNNCVTPCGHTFCFDCIVTSISYKNTCPCCRTVICDDFEIDEEDDEEDDDTETDDDDYLQYNNIIVDDIGECPLVIETCEKLVDIIRRQGNADYHFWILGIIRLIEYDFEWETEEQEDISELSQDVFRNTIFVFKRTQVLKRFLEKHKTNIHAMNIHV